MFFRTMVSAVIISILLTSTPMKAMNILAIEPFISKSHWNFMSTLLRTLTNSGHRVTAFTPIQDGERTNYTEIDISNIKSVLNFNTNSRFLFDKLRKSTAILPLITNSSRRVCDVIYEHPKMKAILDSATSEYDLIIVERVASECVTYVASKFNLPVIFSSPSPIKTTIERSITGDFPNPATVSHVRAYHSVPRTFFQRFSNTLFFMYSTYLMTQKELEMKTMNPAKYDLVDPVKPSLIFVNTHFITEAPRPFPPNVIQVGGIHLQPPGDIPEDILEYIMNSPHGVIYFSFGSSVEMSKVLPEHIQNAFKEAISRVPHRILWKFEGEMKNKPKNVMTRKWFPQREILLHPNVKLFITHGGISGVYEAVDAGVPILGLPIFFDQPRNVENLVDAGMAISLDLLSVTRDTLLNALNELLYNEKYQLNAKIASDRFKDRPMTPANSVVYWTEYVIRHKGAPHLKCRVFDLSWYEYYNLDVIAVVLVINTVIVYIVYKLLVPK